MGYKNAKEYKDTKKYLIMYAWQNSIDEDKRKQAKQYFNKLNKNIMLNELKTILQETATPSQFSGINFFSLAGQLKAKKIKASYLDTVYLLIDYKNNQYILTSDKNADKSADDVIIFDNYILGLNK